MKGILGISLLLCLALPFIVALTFLKNQLHYTKNEVSIKLTDRKDNESEVLLKFTSEESSQLYWEHAKEFEYKGEMYDVIRSEIRGDTNWYWCYWDKKETQIKKTLHNLFAGATERSPINKNTTDPFVRFFKSLFYFIEDKPVHSDITLIQSRANCIYCFGTTSFHPFPPFHPPELS